MYLLPSLDTPCIATNRLPFFTRRESYSTAVTDAFPLWDNTSVPSRSCWKVICLNYMAAKQRLVPCSIRGLFSDQIGQRSERPPQHGNPPQVTDHLQCRYRSHQVPGHCLRQPQSRSAHFFPQTTERPRLLVQRRVPLFRSVLPCQGVELQELRAVPVGVSGNRIASLIPAGPRAPRGPWLRRGRACSDSVPGPA